MNSSETKTQKYNGNEIKERLYATQLHKNISEYKNKSNTLECLTILNGESTIENIKVQTGITIVLEPEESIQLNKSTFITARPLIGGKE